MKKQICGVLAMLMLTGCSASLVNLDYEEGQLINKRLKLAYNAAPTNYEPVSVGEAYGYYGDIDMTLYEITGLDPKQWLTQEYAGSATTIFYSDDQTLPTLSEMAPVRIHVCTGDSITYGIATVDDTDVVAQLVDLYENGEEVEWPMLDSLDTYELKFVSEAYPHLYYNLTYYEYADGIYLYDRNSKRCVVIGDLLETWVENSWEG
ncbi:MAG: membrane lipoprotein lipid attachment site-containing protein [Clostridia bacterium]|nr:membrane lipoprotein lipid attachment site-containing protein [Clostridia bacterium]